MNFEFMTIPYPTCAQIGRCAKQSKVLPHTAVCETICLTD